MLSHQGPKPGILPTFPARVCGLSFLAGEQSLRGLVCVLGVVAHA